MEQTVETLSVRVDKLERDTADLFEKTNTAAVTLAAVNEKLNSMLIALGEVKQAVSVIREIPSKRLDTLFKALITALVSCAAGYVAAKFSWIR